MFNIANGLQYYRFMKQMHESCLFDWYMEVGCRQGRSFAPVRGKPSRLILSFALKKTSFMSNLRCIFFSRPAMIFSNLAF